MYDEERARRQQQSDMEWGLTNHLHAVVHNGFSDEDEEEEEKKSCVCAGAMMGLKVKIAPETFGFIFLICLRYASLCWSDHGARNLIFLESVSGRPTHSLIEKLNVMSWPHTPLPTCCLLPEVYLSHV